MIRKSDALKYDSKDRAGKIEVKPMKPCFTQRDLSMAYTLGVAEPCREIYATLLDEGTYLCSVSTMYRLLGERGEVRERRDQLRHPVYTKPELLTTGPNQLWSWDITELKGPAKWVHFSLYVILDVFSRYVVGWMVAHREAAVLAERLINESCQRQGIVPRQLTIHAARGSSMQSKRWRSCSWICEWPRPTVALMSLTTIPTRSPSSRP
jgi:transposase InsO family protein